MENCPYPFTEWIDKEKRLYPYLEDGCVNISCRTHLTCSEVIEHDRLRRASLDVNPLLNTIVHFYRYRLIFLDMWRCRGILEICLMVVMGIDSSYRKLCHTTAIEI
jgi:hypothetical protein